MKRLPKVRRRVVRLCSWLALAACVSTPAWADQNEIVIGMSASFSGPSRSLGIELYRGTQAYLEQVNQSGGVHGRRIVIRAYDDAYEPNRTIRNTVRLVEEDGVFALMNFVGTPTVTRTLPLIANYASRDILLFFPYTGAEPQRRPPYSDRVFNLRASYRDETRHLVEYLLAGGHGPVAVFYQSDAYGRGGWEGLRSELRKLGQDIRAEATYRRGTSFEASMAEQVRMLRESGANSVVSVCSYEACAAFFRDARNSGWQAPIANLSFAGSEAMAEVLTDAYSAGELENLQGLINAQVVPSYEDLELPAVLEYRAAMQAIGDLQPGQAGESDYQVLASSFASFEGFLNAKLLVVLLQSMGPDPQRSDLLEAAENLRGVDLGIGTPVSFGPGRHQALDRVYLTVLEDGAFVPLRHDDGAGEDGGE